MSDAAIVQFYQSIFRDRSIDPPETSGLRNFLQQLNPPPDKLTKLRATAFKIGSDYLSSDSNSNDQNIELLRTIDSVVHAIEENCMVPCEEPANAVDYDEETVGTFYKTILDELTVDTEESQALYDFFKVTNPPKRNALVETRALAFKIGGDYLSKDNNKEANTQVLRCINVIVHALEMSCYRPKPFHLQEGTTSVRDYKSMSLQEVIQLVWDEDANRLTPGDDYVINVGRGKKPFWKEDAADDPLFTKVDPAVWKRPTYQYFTTLLDNYVAETGAAEAETGAERDEVTRFLNAILETAPMQVCHRYCSARGKAPGDRAGFLQLLRSIWFEMYRRGGRLDSCGFEHVFLGEVKNGEVSGFHNWIRFYLEEKKGNVDYRGYIKPKSNSGALQDENDYLLTLQFSWKGVEKFVGTSFIGVSPEFEMAVYTLCFLLGEEDNRIELKTGTDTFGVVIKCYSMAGNKIGTTFPEVTSHFED